MNPAGRSFIVKEYGATFISPSFIPPLKSSTLVIDPSGSDAFTSTVTVAGDLNDATFYGERNCYNRKFVKVVIPHYHFKCPDIRGFSIVR